MPALEALGPRAVKHQRRDPKEPAMIVTEPTPVDSTILYLCQLCLQAAGAIAYLRDQYETLHEAAQYLEGLPLLERIISSAVDPNNAASVNTYPPDWLALIS